MKKAFLLILAMFLLCPIAASAEEYLEFDFTLPLKKVDVDSESILMEDDAFAARIIEAWERYVTDYIDISDLKLTAPEILEKFADTCFMNPEYVYVQQGFAILNTNGDEYCEKIRVKYVCNDENGVPTEEDIAYYETLKEKIVDGTNEILLHINQSMTDYEKIMAVNDYMVSNYTYDINDTAQDMSMIYDKRGVCTSYALTFIHMMKTLGIEVSYVNSDDLNGDGLKDDAHMWNMVKLDGEWYHIDVTWNDTGDFGVVSRDFALRSDDKIRETHKNFTAKYNAASKAYDGGVSLSVQANSVTYFVNGNNLTDEFGNIIYKNLDGGDAFWNISSNLGFPNEVMAGLCEINGVLYFNTDSAVLSYNPLTGKTETLVEKTGVCGLYADKNMVRYNAFDTSSGAFVEGGSIRACDVRYNEADAVDGVVAQMVYNDTEESVWAFSAGEGYMVQSIPVAKVTKAEFDNGENQRILIWEKGLKPLK